MSSEDELQSAINKTFAAYEVARKELHDAVGAIGYENLYAVLSMAEEFGAGHARKCIQHHPGQYDLEAHRAAAPEWGDTLEAKLQSYIDANENLDGAVANMEQWRMESGRGSETRTIAFHGEFPVVDLVNNTVTFPGRTPEPLVLTEGRGPDSPEPEPTHSRSRKRGMSR